MDDGSLREVANEIRDTQEWDEVKKGVDGLEEAVKEAASHKYFNYALLAMGGVTLLVALFGFCGAKKESQCLLSLYSICVFIIPLLAGGVWRIVDDGSLREVANEIRDTQEWDEVKKGVDGLEEAVKEAASHKYFNYALLAMGGVTLLVALF